jgi:hypothetical protein
MDGADERAADRSVSASSLPNTRASLIGGTKSPPVRSAPEQKAVRCSARGGWGAHERAERRARWPTRQRRAAVAGERACARHSRAQER